MRGREPVFRIDRHGLHMEVSDTVLYGIPGHARSFMKRAHVHLRDAPFTSGPPTRHAHRSRSFRSGRLSSGAFGVSRLRTAGCATGSVRPQAPKCGADFIASRGPARRRTRGQRSNGRTGLGRSIGGDDVQDDGRLRYWLLPAQAPTFASRDSSPPRSGRTRIPGILPSAADVRGELRYSRVHGTFVPCASGTIRQRGRGHLVCRAPSRTTGRGDR